jgi:hypothetical protein
MASTPAIEVEEIKPDDDANLWDVMRAASRVKEAKPNAPLLPSMRILKFHDVVATVYQSSEEPRTLLVRSRAGLHKVTANWCDLLIMLYRTVLLMLQQMGGTSVIFLGERPCGEAGRAMICAMRWSAHQFTQQPSPGSFFPETRDSISRVFCLHDSRICWLSEATAALQFS